MVGLSPAHTAEIPGPYGPLESLTRGSGQPCTLFVHGLGGSIDTTRPYAGLAPGRQTFLHIAGHGTSSPPAEWTYRALAAEVWSAADEVQATAALGISMGAGALCAGLARDPKRFEALVLILPAPVDRPRSDKAAVAFEALATVVASGDVEAVTAHLVASEPATSAQDPRVLRWCRGQAERLMTGSAREALARMPGQRAVEDPEALRRVQAPVLILAAEGDPIHPVDAADRLAGLLPHADLEVLPEGGIMWAHRDRVRQRVGDFLAEHAQAGPNTTERE
ncbi:MAG: alpha/beta fold hydrolase [Ornithinimicrobium sp.]